MRDEFERRLNSFYLDVSRYLFDYMFDLDESSINVSLKTYNDLLIIKSLLKVNKIYGEGTDVVSIIYLNNQLFMKFAKNNKTISVNKLIEILYRYAKKEDESLAFRSSKSLFVQNLDFGLKKIGYLNK